MTGIHNQIFVTEEYVNTLQMNWRYVIVIHNDQLTELFRESELGAWGIRYALFQTAALGETVNTKCLYVYGS